MNYYEWARRWNIPYEAIKELQHLAHPPSVETRANLVTEAAVSNAVKLEATRKGARLMRNNRGAGFLDSGNFVRFGVGHETKKDGEDFCSSDLIGIRPVKITEAHVGLVIGQFLAREIKKPGWHYTGRANEPGQLNFINFINAFGGDAAFTDCVGSL